MAELFFFIVALLCLFWSAEASVFFLVIAAGIIAVKRSNLAMRLEEVQSGFDKAIGSLKDEVSELRVQLRALRAERATASPIPEVAITASAPRVAPAEPAPAHVPAVAPASKPAVTVVPSEAPSQVTIKQPEPKPAAVEPLKSPVSRPEPATPIVPKPLAPPPTVAAPHQAPITAPLPQAAHSTPAYVSPMLAKLPPISAQRPPAKPFGERMKSALAVEEVLGTDWLNKLGIIILVLGVALFGIYELGQMGPAGKVLLSFTAAIGLLVAGIMFEKRERYRVLGRTGIGGGWALLFFIAYAMYHVPAMRLPLSETADVLLMLVVAAGMAIHTLRYKSQLVTGLAFLLGYSTVALSHDTVYSLSAGAVLAISLVVLVIKMNWYELEIFGILSSYLNHLYFLYKILGPEGANHRRFSEFCASTTILLLYWLVYRGSYIARKIHDIHEEHVSTLAALLNTVLLLAVMKFQSSRPELAFYALLALGLLEFGLGQLPITKRRRIAFVILSTMGAVLMIAAVPFRYSGGNVALLWLVGAEVLLAAGIAVKEKVFRRLGLLAGLAAAFHVVIVDAQPFFEQRLSGESPLISSGILFLTLSAVFYLNSQVLCRRWAKLFEDSLESGVMLLHSYLGAIALSLGVWAIWTADWTVLGWAAVIVVLAFAAGKLLADDLFVHCSALAAVALGRAIIVNLRAGNDAVTHGHRLIAIPLLAATYYVSAKFISKLDSDLQRLVRDLFVWAGTVVVAVLIWREIPAAWIAVAWIAFGLALTLIGRRLKVGALCYQENALAVAAIIRVILYNYSVEKAYGHFTLRLITVTLVAAAFYVVSRKSSLPEFENWKPVAYLHTLAATGLLAALAWYETPTVWLAVVWAAFALMLTAVDGRFELSDLRWQGHALAALAAIRVAAINFQIDQNLHGVSLRLISVVIVIFILYGLSRFVRVPEAFRQRDIHHIYSWTASAFAAVLMWYELQPLSVAVAWGLFGLLLIESGLLRKSAQIRFQGYAALGSAFVRIFFANLAVASTPGQGISPRILTVVPLATIIFFIYSQLEKQKDELIEKRARVDSLLCYAGTIAVSALLYFELAPRAAWIVTAWSVLIMALFAVALLLHRRIFLHQGLLLAIAGLFRGIFHNLFGESYFTGSDWTGRLAVLGSAIAVMFLTLPFAFRLRVKGGDHSASGFKRFLTNVANHPEQIMFFVPFVLLTLMLALKLRFGMVTIGWGVEALFVFALAFIVGEYSYRFAGMGLVLVCAGKIMIIDAWRLQPRDRYITFIILGAAILTVSFLYSKHREAIRKLI
jgi:Predicted membrane protein (DUF2339)